MATIYGYKKRYWKVVKEFYYTGKSEPFTLEPGTYLLICNGARGGRSTSSSRATNYGGTSYGVLTLEEPSNFYAVVGGNGEDSIDTSTLPHGGFNGGGNGSYGYDGAGNSEYTTGPGGGGASDIRIIAHPIINNDYVLNPAYQELEYIETGSGSSNYIRTDYKHKKNTTVEWIGVSNPRYQTYTWEILFGARYGNNNQQFFFQVSSETKPAPNYSVGNGGVSGTASIFPYGEKIRIKTNGSSCSWFKGENLDELVETVTAPYEMCDGCCNLILFGMANNSTSPNQYLYSYGKLYSFKIWEDDVLVRYYVPCYRRIDGVVGIYDLLHDVFIRCTGGSFIRGPEINRSDPEKELLLKKSLLSRLIVAGGGGGSVNIMSDKDILDNTGGGGGIVGGIPMMDVSWATDPSFNSKQPYPTQLDGYSFGLGMTAPDKASGYEYSLNGAGGAGGGWFGGFACPDVKADNASINGGGGSGYVLTKDSYKPEGYSVDEKYYLTDTFLNSSSGDEEASIFVCRLTKNPQLGDTVIFPCIGETDEFLLLKGTYRIKCWGGDGGSRYHEKYSARGGYAEGVFMNPSTDKMYVSVGGTGLYAGIPGYGDNEYCRMFHPTIGFNGGGTPAGYGSQALGGTAGGGASDVRIGSDSLYARLIVAGGAGGMGAPGSRAGAGGGTTGTSGSGSYGTQPGPGTQTSSPQNTSYPTICGGFGYAGNGINANSGYGGAGGGGWFGGSGVHPDGSGDDDKAGCGGSGYVLTADSYKPEGYLLGEDYYMTNTILTQGGNNLPYGHTKIEMDVLDICVVKLLTHDNEGYKYFSNEENKWTLMSDTLPTIEDFDSYGCYSIMNDDGLLDEYEVLAYDPDDVVNIINFDVVPPKQTIINVADTSIRVSKLVLDAEYDEDVFNITTSSSRQGIADDAKVALTVDIDKKIISDSKIKVYCVYANAFSSAGKNRYIAPKKPVDENPSETKKKYLLKVGTGNKVPIRYKRYLGSLDGASITSIYSAVSCEHNRTLYIAALVNNTTLRIVQINLITGKVSLVRDILRNKLDNYYYGGLLADDDYIYITSSYNDNRYTIYRIEISNPDSAIKTFSPGNNSSYYFTSFGKMVWFDGHTIVIDYREGFMLFDTIKGTFTIKKYSSTKNNRADMSVGKNIAISNYNGSETTVLVCEIESNTWSTVTLPTNTQSCSCYDGNGKFYIAQTQRLSIMDEETKTIERTIVVPWDSPKTIDYTNGILYVTIKTSNRLWIYNTKTDMFTSIMLQWTIPKLTEGYITRPTVFDGYILIPYWSLGIVNYAEPVKYNMGFKYNQFSFMFDEEHKNEFTYDDRFVTFKNSYMTIHDGVITKQLSLLDNDTIPSIKTASINKSEYNILKKATVSKENIIEEGDIS